MPGDFVSPLFWNINGEKLDGASLSAWSAFTGQTEEEAAQDWGWLNAVHPADREHMMIVWKQMISSEEVLTLFCRIRHQSGDYQRFKILNIPLFNAEHQVQSRLVFFSSTFTDSPVLKEQGESELLSRAIWQQSTAGILYLSLDGKIIRVNDRLCTFTGYTEEELLSLTLWQLSMPEDVDRQLQIMQNGLLSGQDQPPFRIRYQRKDGTFLWVRLSAFTIRLLSGEPVGFFFVIEDVSEQVQAEIEHVELLEHVREAHAEAEARASLLEAVFESISDGIMVSDSNSRIIHSNAAVSRVLHLDSVPNFLKMPFRQRIQLLQAFDEHGQRLTPDQWALARLMHGENLQETGNVDIREILPDGEEIYVNHTGSVMRDQDGQIVGAVLVIHDVTKRRWLEQHVRKSFDVLLALAEELVHIPGRRSETPSVEQLSSGQLSPALSLQAVGEYLVETSCQMLDYQSVAISLLDTETEHLCPVAMTSLSSKEDWRRKEFSTFAFSDSLDEASLARLQDNEVILWDLTPYSPEHQPYKLLTAPMILDERLVGVLSVEKRNPRQDYTPEEISLVKAVAKMVLLVLERERLMEEWIEARSSEQVLREANRRFDEFISIASHELRTPLAGIKGNIQLALRRLGKLRAAALSDIEELWKKLENVENYLSQAEHRVNVQNRMISDLLDVSRIQANKLELVMGLCDLSVIVNEAVEDQRYNSPGRLIALTMPPGGQVMVNGDADRIGQVIHNYLTNALKYSPPEQSVAVSIELDEQKNMARVLVRDKGPGLTAEEQKRVWERFYRVKGIVVQSGSGPGLGLGLHISRTIIEAHEGSLGLESTVGEGSTFWFALPLAEQASHCSEGTTHFQTQSRGSV